MVHLEACFSPTDSAEEAYFDTLTRFYLETDVAPGTYLMDDITFYQETAVENDAQVYALAGNYNPGNNDLIVTWHHNKDDQSTSHEVRYAFSDIHQIGWNAATAAPNGIVARCPITTA